MQLKNNSLYHQFIVPITVVGLVCLSAVVFSAYKLQEAVRDLEQVYDSSGVKLRTIEEVETSVTRLRALSLRHMASESFTSMSRVEQELREAIRKLDEQLGNLMDIAPLPDGEEGKNGALGSAIQDYQRQLEEMLRLSSDFEKETAFIRLTHAESRYLPLITASLYELKRRANADIAMQRHSVSVNADANVFAAIAMGAFAVFLISLIVFVVIRRTTRRIDQILDWSREVAGGNLTAHLSVDVEDEIGRLAGSMKIMAHNIKQAHDELGDAKNMAERTAEELQLYAKAFDNSGEAMLITNSQNRIIDVNSAFTTQTGYTLDDVIDQDPKMFASGETPPGVYRELWTSLQQNDFWQGELWDIKKDGVSYPKWIRISAIRDSSDVVLFYIASFSDITERKESEARIEHLAHHDILTGLLNRFSMEERLVQAIATAHRTQQRLALLFIDLDRFKSVNDSLGHHAGDALLAEVAVRLQSCVRESDIVARIGGDEFVVVLNDIRDNLRAAVMAESIMQKMAVPFKHQELTLDTTPSIGISIYPDDGMDVDELLRNADVAMYHAKEMGRNNYQYFDRKMLEEASQRLYLERELRVALASNQLQLHYQPLVAAGQCEVVALEALVRWTHPKEGAIAPDKFIPIAEDCGLIHELGRWVFNEACRQIVAWRNGENKQCRLAINLSAKQLQSTSLVTELESIMKQHGVSGHELELEMTESVAMIDPELSVVQLQSLRELGLGLAIDDFGTGYSSLAYLKRLPINILKLDRSFVRDIESDVNDAEICSATVALAHNLGLKVVAEGVETEAQRNFLQGLGCDYLQGFLFSRPLPAEAASALIGTVIEVHSAQEVQH